MDDKKHVDFNAWVEILTRLTARAQATFLNSYIRQLSPSLCRSVIKYCYARLAVINGKEPEITHEQIESYIGSGLLAPHNKARVFADDEKLN